MRRKLIEFIVIFSVGIPFYQITVSGYQATAASDVEKQVRQFFDTWRQKDLEAVMEFWAKDSPQYDKFRQFAGRIMAAGKDERFADFAFSHWEVDDNKAIVRVQFTKEEYRAEDDEPNRQLIVWNLQLKKKGGVWKFWDQEDAVGALIYYLLNEAQNPQVRAQLFMNSRDLVSTDLVYRLNRIVREETRQENFSEALRVSDVALEAAELLGQRRYAAQTYEARGLIFSAQKMYPKTLDNFKIALPLYLNAGDTRGTARVLNNVGIIYGRERRLGEALVTLKESLRLRRTLSDRGGMAKTLVDIGEAYRQSGRYAEGLASLSECLTITEEQQYRAQRAEALNNAGIIYRQVGQYDEALAKLTESLILKRALSDKAGEARTLHNIGIVYANQGKFQEALAKFEESLKIKRTLPGQDGVESVLIDMGITYGDLGDNSKALSTLNETLRLATSTGNKQLEATVQTNLSGLYLKMRQDAPAQESAERALALARSLESDDLALGPYAHLGFLHLRKREWREAADAYRNAIKLIELLRARTVESSLQISFFQKYISPYYGLVESLLELGQRTEEAFATSERAKARTLVELLSAGKATPTKELSDVDRQRELELNAAVVAATDLLDRAESRPDSDAGQIASLRRTLHQARLEYDDFRRRIFLTHSDLQTQRAQFEPATLIQLNQVLFSKQPELCLFSYVVGDGKVFLFAITRGKGINSPALLRVYALKTEAGADLTAEALAALVNDFRKRCASESGVYKPLARDLYKLLIAPAEGELTGKTHLVIIPDRILNTLPFQILIDGQSKHLIESLSISFAPSATALLEMLKLSDKRKMARPGSMSLFVMGRTTFPDQAKYRSRELPWAGEQVDSIASLFHVRAYKDREATKNKAIAEMGKARYVHFATHGELNEVSPMYSAIVLGKDDGNDGMLYARDLLDMNLQADLIVLSACETALGQQTNGEGLLGLQWSLFVAGVSSSVVTQWSVRADSTRDLMVKFYEPLANRATNVKVLTGKGEALRRAQLSLLNSPEYSHPYHWGPFVLIGDWR